MLNAKNISTTEYSTGEELANGITHGIGAFLSIIGIVFLILNAAYHGDVWHVVSVSVFGVALVVLYSASTLYHSIESPSWKPGLKKFDHSAIYILIAGTYTPYLLVHMRSPAGWTLFGVIWSLAVIGVVMKLFFTHKIKAISIGLYLFMGWLCVIVLRALANVLPPASLALLVAGGILYTIGIIFYAWKKMPYSHAVWHLFVLGGSISHYFSILKIDYRF